MIREIDNTIVKLVLAVVLSYSGMISLSHASDDTVEEFLTQETLEPDIWASVWLINKVLGNKATVVVEPTPRTNRNRTSFGFLGADIFSTKGSHYAMLLEILDANNSTLTELGKIVAGVEDLGWQADANQSVSRFEAEFRKLQSSHGRYWVPLGCYKSFFDNLYAGLDNNLEDLYPGVKTTCKGDSFEGNISKPSIPMIPIPNVLKELAEGKNIVFVDTREPSEYAERHIPGAINLPFRDLANADMSKLNEADIVIPYCIKDFRGFEAARRLVEQGVENVSLLDPFGLAGWQSSELPLAGDKALDPVTAENTLEECVVARCLDDGKPDTSVGMLKR